MNPTTVEKCRRAPELGPTLLFFSGGGALRDLCRQLKRYTHNSIHVVTAFDSGGSSAELRKTFAMPPVGDLRFRLTALADESRPSDEPLYEFFSHRFSPEASQENLRAEFAEILRGEHPLARRLTPEFRKVTLDYLKELAPQIPHNFNFRNASLGNLAITAAYLKHDRSLETALYVFSNLLHVRGKVRPVCTNNLHLIANLENGETLTGQHKLTGKETAPIQSKIQSFYLSKTMDTPAPETAHASPGVLSDISTADLICYPMGSFYSSVIANLLPKGIPEAICKNPCKKVFVPSTGYDPEQFGMSIHEAALRIIDVCTKDNALKPTDILTHVLVDTKSEPYALPFDPAPLQKLGIEILDVPAVCDKNAPNLNPRLLTHYLLSLSS